tara:strand:- start:2450 stop:3544 length:1095 start_codon:yes stop_codon:yes gene_type:complete
MRQLLIAGILTLISVTFFYFVLRGNTKVQVTPVVLSYPHQDLAVLKASGYVVAQKKAALSSKATGRLEWLGVKEGSKVSNGELVAILERDDLSARLKFNESQVGLARVELQDSLRAYDRATKLLAKKYISEAAFDENFARLEKAKANLKSAEAAKEVAIAEYEQAEIRAPFDGVVLTKNADVGDNITPFSAAADSKGAVVTIADMSSLEVEIDVSESSLSKIFIGQMAVISLDAIDNKKFYGKVVRMVPTIDRAKATRLIKVGFLDQDERVLPDMSAKVVFLENSLKPSDDKAFLSVIKEAVIFSNDQSFIFLVNENMLKKLDIPKVLNRNMDYIPVNNVSLGDKVVINPAESFTNGLRVEVVQ